MPTTQAEQEHDPTPWYRRSRDAAAFDHAKERLRLPMTALALVFTVALLLDLRRDLPGWLDAVVTATNIAIWLAFALEYLWLARLAPDRGRFFRTHLLDLAIVLLPMFRPLRALRVLRIFAVAARSWHQVFSVLRHRGLGKIISSVVALMLVGGLITFALEPETFTTVGDAIWWVLVTSTTVGYGDFAPVGLGGRLVAVLVMVVGIGLVGVITANIVDFMMTDDGEASEAQGSASAGGTTPAEAGHAAHCPGCADTSARLERIEARLDLLLDAAGPDGHAPEPSGT